MSQLLNHDMSSEQPLRSVIPACYHRLLEEFKAFHLHSYDVKADTIIQDGGYSIILRFGDDLKHVKEKLFSHEMVTNLDTTVIDFFRDAGESCKQALIADYFKMMKL
ncbi:hypothetical protein [Brevibacillus daliensis]|uniref:hypothetical protein n=1 Tax=Brevibacillus daliensis TaxID=2892995 RepID=UPI001E48CE8A|nr:hypothetical protein [Brevibacillus daliensis]